MPAPLLPRLIRQTREQSARLGHWARRRGLVPCRRDYVRFIIAAPARCGTNLLAHTLGSHPGIVCDGEIFHVNEATCEFLRDGYEAIKRDPATARLKNSDPGRFIDELVFTPMPARIRAVGFKLMYIHGNARGNPTAREVLRADASVRVVHMRRRNLLEKLLSVAEARRSHTWRRLAGSTAEEGVRIDAAPVVLDAAVLEAAFAKLSDVVAAQSRSWSGHELLEVDYEDLNADFAGTVARVQRFLGAAELPLQPRTEKLAGAPASERIANYDELRRHFAGTRWAEFFAG